MIDSGLYLPLRLYSEEEHMSLNRKECEGFSHEEYFWCEDGVLVPFIYEDGSTNDSVLLINLCETGETSLNIGLQQIDVNTAPEGSPPVMKRFIYFSGGAAATPKGTYRIKVSTKGGFMYSDPIIFGDIEDKINIKYRDKGLRGDIYWVDNLYAECYINSTIEKPEYPILEEVREDEEMNQHKVFQRWEKRHRIRFFGVESMADAMSLLPTMDEVYINSQRVYNVLVDIAWEEDRQCLAEIVISFSVKKMIKAF